MAGGGVMLASIVLSGVAWGATGLAIAIGAWGLLVSTMTQVFGLWRPWAPKPEITVKLRVGDSIKDPVVIAPDRPHGFIDHQAVIASARRALEATAPAPPREPTAMEKLSFSVAVMASQATQKAALARFSEKLDDYEVALGEWLGEYERQREVRARFVECALWVENGGDAPADDLHLRLKLPQGLRFAGEEPTVERPPKPPKYEEFESFLGPSFAGLDLSPIPKPSSLKGLFGNLRGPERVREDGHEILVFRVATLPPKMPEGGDAAIPLLADGPGTYEIEWQAFAGNLKMPARGKLVVECPEPLAGEVVKTFVEIIEAPQVPIEE
jgi:hypothetical protein